VEVEHRTNFATSMLTRRTCLFDISLTQHKIPLLSRFSFSPSSLKRSLHFSFSATAHSSPARGVIRSFVFNYIHLSSPIGPKSFTLGTKPTAPICGTYPTYPRRRTTWIKTTSTLLTSNTSPRPMLLPSLGLRAWSRCYSTQ
jgi:hypothetical protein